MKLLVVSPVPTHPVNAGHRARIWALVGMARELGHDVWLAHIERERGDPALMRKALGSRFVPIPWREPESAKAFRRSVANPGWRRWRWRRGLVSMGLDDWWDPGVEGPLRALHEAERFDAVCAEYVFASRALGCFPPGVRTLLDTHDRFGGRAWMLARHGIEPNFFYTTRREEARGLGRAGVVLAIQAEEARYFRRAAPRGTRVETVSHAVELRPLPEPVCAGDSADSAGVVLYVGSDNSANVHGMLQFLAGGWPEVRRRAAGARLRLVGSIGERVPDTDGVVKLGRVDDLAAEYAGAAVVVNPTVFGTGIKIKSLEALGFGVPLVTTPEGAKGLGGVGSAALGGTPDGVRSEVFGSRGFVVARGARLADVLVEVLSRDDLRARMRQGAAGFAREWNAAQRAALARALGTP